MGLRPYISSVGAFAKYLLRIHSSSCHVSGLERFMQLLADESRRKSGRGILTYANHISVIDDPGIFGAMPWSSFRKAHQTRWTLGASDIMFTNPFLSKCFAAGQVISTDRGRGMFQPAIDTAISKLDQGHWIHLFPEGYVNLSRKMVLRRFKWGLSRMLLEAKERPRVVPIWIEGFDQMMPDPRNVPRFIPRPFANLSICFGEPIDYATSALTTMLDDLRTRASLNTVGWRRETSALQSRIPPKSSEEPSRPRPEAPSIPIPSPASFPNITSHPRPDSGWPPPPEDSAAFKALKANESDEKNAFAARSALVEILRRELAWLGMQSRKERGLDEGEVGRLAHTLMPEAEDGPSK